MRNSDTVIHAQSRRDFGSCCYCSGFADGIYLRQSGENVIKILWLCYGTKHGQISISWSFLRPQFLKLNLIHLNRLNIKNDKNPELFVFGMSIYVTSDYQLVILASCGTRIAWASLENRLIRDWCYDSELSFLILVGYINLCIYSYN